MIQDNVIIRNRHNKFIKVTCESGIVYGLKNRKGFAMSSSVHHENNSGEPLGIICFWAEKVRAKSCVKDGWRKYKVVEISLSDFIENWCIGIKNDGFLVGTQFDKNMFGFEAEPLELILDLITELETQGKDLSFRKFAGISDLKKQVKLANE